MHSPIYDLHVTLHYSALLCIAPLELCKIKHVHERYQTHTFASRRVVNMQMSETYVKLKLVNNYSQLV